eukprot:TRINITY_DN399_c0_g1_i2.p1 TRINITY_DN399_c0_g1~~TRINITY_DN399_c0_g1_i2.p1  ORF type:complete len:283 (+),score=111.21 TRINITY_DN399_c0_g1_i2:83-850(+)
MQGATLSKAIVICFGLFALMAISTSTSSRQMQARSVAVESAKKIEVQQVNTVSVPAGAEGAVTQKNSASEAAQTNAKEESVTEKKVESEAKPVMADHATQAKDVHVTVHVNLRKEALAEAVKETVAKSTLLSTDEVKEVAKQVEKAATTEEKVEKATIAQEKVEKPVEAVKLPEAKTVKQAAAPVPTKVVKPASASVLVVPLLAMVAVLVAVKVRKPGYLPEAVEEKLETMGFPAQEIRDTWRASKPSRSMYGSV